MMDRLDQVEEFCRRLDARVAALEDPKLLDLGWVAFATQPALVARRLWERAGLTWDDWLAGRPFWENVGLDRDECMVWLVEGAFA